MYRSIIQIQKSFQKMETGSNNKNTDADEPLQWIEDGIIKNYINYHDYNEFQNIQQIGFGAYGKVYRATLENSNTVVALKSFENSKCVVKEVVNEVQKLFTGST